MEVRFAGVTLAGILSLAFSNISKAQTTTGSIAGRVLEESGKTVEGAGITVTSPAIQGEMRATTDQKGEYHLSFVPPSQQTRISIEAGGYGQVSFIVIVSRGRDHKGHCPFINRLRTGGYRRSSRRRGPPGDRSDDPSGGGDPVHPVLGEFQDRSYQSIFYFSPTHPLEAVRQSRNCGSHRNRERLMLDGIYTNNFVTGTYGTNST